ncbi:uncharacterized protein J8A68_002632 [[Candida] subhashii]|uniref:Uncharacterized protein n=1 Tax=[Candida] subhashii TaxID=561895 RepID=A0A8J5QR62_9ASCO|nr:uncharacterized protein J8A68_002632 [[Candida] subhashii]KAG7663772.1 hypothetical protein J8A68_002632 [[Candida] subhashii]
MKLAYFILYALISGTSILNSTTHLPTLSAPTNYFLQSDPSTPTDASLPNFGLNKNYTWQTVLENLQPNQKLFFIQRHGDAYHNIAPSLFSPTDWNCYWQFQPGDGNITWEDAELTPTGQEEIRSLSTQIQNTTDFPEVEVYYVSPLRRTLETWDLTWRNHTDKIPTIKELSRETYGLDTESERHSESYISENYPGFDFESGFSEEDVLWTPNVRENSQHRNFRAATLLTDIFRSNNGTNVISIVSHANLISSILQVVGHRSWSLATGGMIPVVIGINDVYMDYELNQRWLDYSDLCSNSKFTKTMTFTTGRTNFPDVTTTIEAGLSTLGSTNTSETSSESHSTKTNTANYGLKGASFNGLLLVLLLFI